MMIMIDGIHRYWFKKFTSIHDRLAIEMKKKQMDDKSKDNPNPKIPPRETVPKNYRPIICLPMMWKVGDRNRGRPKASLFNSYYTEV